MAEYTISDFDIERVKLGATIGFQNTSGDIHKSTYVRMANDNSKYVGYVAFDGNSTLYGFQENGRCYDPNGISYRTLNIIEANINKNTGTIITRGDDAEKFSISTLQPRETVALTCLQSMLSSFDVPLNIDNTKIKQLVDKSFMFAQEFFNQAVKYREKETASSTATSDKNVSVDSSSLSSDTDKILYNIQVALNNLITQDKNQFTEQQKNGLKLAATDVNIKTVPENIKTVVSGKVDAAVTGSINASVSGSVNSSVSGSVNSSVSGSVNATVSGSITTNQESAPSGT